MNRLQGKVAIVTGGTRGIGYAIVQKLCREGARVLIADILEETPDIAAALCGEGFEAVGFVGDLSSVEVIFSMVESAVERWGSLDLLVNNAGVQKPLTSLQMTEEWFDRIMGLNIRSPFFCCQAAAKKMRNQGGGVIVNISSGNSRMVNVGRAPYTISKHGINALTAVLGAEWAMFGIRVNAVAPGLIKTALSENGIRTGALNEQAAMSVVPMNRWGTVEEVADAVCFLASDEARYITGQTLFVDGGWNTGMMPNALDFVKNQDL